jgi:hypothetical protein
LGFTRSDPAGSARRAAYEKLGGSERRFGRRVDRGAVSSGSGKGGFVTQWYLLAVSLPVKIDAQKNPVPAILLFAVVSALLWFAMAQARHHDSRRSGPGRRSENWSRRPPRY